jgi:hypothetical protein
VTRSNVDPDLERLGEALRASTAIELARAEQAARPSVAERRRHPGAGFATRARRVRPRLLAGGSLGLAGVGAALMLVLSAGGAAAPPAFAITTNNHGAVLVKFNTTNTHRGYLAAVDSMLAAKYQETILVDYAPGPAVVAGPVNCAPVSVPAPDAGAKTPVKVLLGEDGTAVIPSGTTGAGTVHLSGCSLYLGAPGTGNSGNAGNS